MTFSKGLLIATLSLAVFAFSAPANATTEAKPAEAAQPAAAMAPAAKPAANADKEAPAMARMQQNVDIKNLPKNIGPLIPKDGDTFILSVGETKLITAARPRKCVQKEAPTFDEVKVRFPQNDLITFSDGGLYERFAPRCGGLVPARAIFATGAKKGTQKLYILGFDLTVIVK